MTASGSVKVDVGGTLVAFVEVYLQSRFIGTVKVDSGVTRVGEPLLSVSR